MVAIYEDLLEWINDKILPIHRHKNLFKRLYDIEFVPILPLDSNRIQDGVSLRYKYAEEHDIHQDVIDSLYDNSTCSVLEMMVGLAYRMEDQFMSDGEYGDRTITWLWVMLKSMGLYYINDDVYSEDPDQFNAIIENIVLIFLSREYEPDGTGSLFKIPNCQVDLRDTEIWSQMCMFIDRLL